MSKRRLSPETRATLEGFGIIEAPGAPTIDKLADAIKARKGEFALKAGGQDASKRPRPTTAVVTLKGLPFEATHPFDNIAVADAFAKGLRETAEQQATLFKDD